MNGLDAGPFDHPALLYRQESDYVAGTTSFVQAALAAGEPVLVAVPPSNLDQIRRALGRDAGRVQFADMTRAGRNPGRILPGVLLPFANAHPGRRVAVIGEPVWADRTDVEYPACAAHEALINAAFAGRDAAILCPYNISELAPDRVADAYRTHPVTLQDGARRSSPGYLHPFETAAMFNQPLPAPPADPAGFTYQDAADLGPLREFLLARAADAGLSEDRAMQLALAITELAANTIEYSGGPGRLSTWIEGGILVCHLSDSGHLADPLIGRLPVSADAARGRGMVLVNLLCDLVRVHTRDSATEIRLHTHL